MTIRHGENKIDENSKHTCRVYHHHLMHGKLLYTLYPIKEQNITTLTMQRVHDLNATDFNKKVIIKCGVLLGYLLMLNIH